jgi:hypothetical protein
LRISYVAQALEQKFGSYDKQERKKVKEEPRMNDYDVQELENLKRLSLIGLCEQEKSIEEENKSPIMSVTTLVKEVISSGCGVGVVGDSPIFVSEGVKVDSVIVGSSIPIVIDDTRKMGCLKPTYKMRLLTREIGLRQVIKKKKKRNVAMLRDKGLNALKELKEKKIQDIKADFITQELYQPQKEYREGDDLSYHNLVDYCEKQDREGVGMERRYKDFFKNTMIDEFRESIFEDEYIFSDFEQRKIRILDIAYTVFSCYSNKDIDDSRSEVSGDAFVLLLNGKERIKVKYKNTVFFGKCGVLFYYELNGHSDSFFFRGCLECADWRTLLLIEHYCEEINWERLNMAHRGIYKKEVLPRSRYKDLNRGGRVIF